MPGGFEAPRDLWVAFDIISGNAVRVFELVDDAQRWLRSENGDSLHAYSIEGPFVAASSLWCTGCGGFKPGPGREHVVDSDGDIVLCREELASVEHMRRRADGVLRQALGSELWNRLWGPELERLGGAVDELVAAVRAETVEACAKELDAMHARSNRQAYSAAAQRLRTLTVVELAPRPILPDPGNR
jgi:hypothetical protein